MNFYYEIEYKNGNRMGGYNCISVKVKDNALILEGLDMLHDCDGDHRQYWKHIDNLAEIKSFKLE